MGCLIAYDMYRGRLQGWKGSDLDWSNYMDNNDDVWNVGGTGEYPPLNPLFTNIGDAYFDCIWRVAGVLTGNISWISPAGVPQSSLSRFIGVLCFFYLEHHANDHGPHARPFPVVQYQLALNYF